MLLIGTVLPASGTSLIDKTTLSNISGDTLYVGGSGEDNYSKIQDAINDSSDGDTVFVYDDSAPYYENLIVGKSINLIGENRDTTIIDGSGVDDVIYISADWVNIHGFSVQNGSPYDGIGVYSDNNNISGNYINEACSGIYLKKSINNTISNNVVFRIDDGVFLSESSYNIISGNVIDGDGFGSGGGIQLEKSHHNTIIFNNIKNNNYGRGIWLLDSRKNLIFKNNIKSNGAGIHMQWSYNNEIISNNFKKNFQGSAFMEFELQDGCYRNKWDGNYWNRPRVFPKLIFGYIEISHGDIPWFNIDWRPAKEPYDI
jgi:parallel beta-helix repeat protein